MKSATIIVWILATYPLFVTASDNDTLAREAFKDGVTAFEAGEVAAALVSFERAYALRPSYKILFNIAQAQAEVGQTAKAIRTFEKYLQDGGGEISEGRRTKVDAEIKRLRLLAASKAPPKPVAPEPVYDEGVSIQEEIVLPNQKNFLFDIAPWISAGLGATTLTIGIALGATTASLNKTLTKDCFDGACDASYRDDIDKLKGRALAADLMFVTTSLFTATAVSLIVIGKKRKGRTP